MTLTARFVQDFETNMQLIMERSYVSLTDNLWWNSVLKTRTSKTRKEVFAWLLSTAQIKDISEAGGSIEYDDAMMLSYEVIPRTKGSGFRIGKNELEDQDANGVQAASQWAADIGSYMAYWPQKLATDLIKNGHTAASYTAYDGKALFATDHPLNPYNVGLGTYSNLISSVDISTNVDTDTALKNLQTILATIASIKQPNGVDPRFLRPEKILCGPKLMPRAVQLTNAKFLAQAVGSAGGTGDVEMLIKSMGYATPTMADELAGFESDTTFFVVAKQVAQSEIGAGIYVEREPFNMSTYTGADGQNVDLGRGRELEWQVQGRNGVAAGHPYLIFKCKAGA